MNRTIKTSTIKLTIFFVTSLFAMTLLMQSTAYGQITPTIRPTRPPTSIDIKSFRPDLRIGDIKYDAKNCTVNIRVVNSGTSAGIFNVWVELVGAYKYPPLEVTIQSVTELAGDSDLRLNFNLFSDPSKPLLKPGSAMAAKLLGGQERFCRIDNLVKVRAVVDPRYVYITAPEASMTGMYNSLKSINLLPLGSAAPKKQSDQETVTVVEPQVEELNENNNELTVSKGDMKLYP